jgi:hypothetical protein
MPKESVALFAKKPPPNNFLILELLFILIIFLIYKQGKISKNPLILRLRRANVWEPVGAEAGKPEG